MGLVPWVCWHSRLCRATSEVGSILNATRCNFVKPHIFSTTRDALAINVPLGTGSLVWQCATFCVRLYSIYTDTMCVFLSTDRYSVCDRYNVCVCVVIYRLNVMCIDIMCVFVCGWPQKLKSQYPGISLIISPYLYLTCHLVPQHLSSPSRKSQYPRRSRTPQQYPNP